MEATAGFEPANKGFADPRLTTWLRRLGSRAGSATDRCLHGPSGAGMWSGKRDSNPRPQPWQGCALPLSYSRPAGEEPIGPVAACQARRLAEGVEDRRKIG